jgi:Protein of unknown function (DUF2380)
MSWFRFARHGLALVGLIIGSGLAASPSSAAPEAQRIGVAIQDFTYFDTSGEPIDQTAAHQRRLQAFMTAIRRDVEAADELRLTPLSCNSPCAGDDLARAASAAGASIVVVGGIQKMSTLVQLAKVTVIEIGPGRLVFDRRYTFRGDNDEAWVRAEAFVSRDIRAALAAAPPVMSATATPAPIRLAVFDFEQEDTSAAVSSTPETAADDAAQLADVTGQVRRLLAQSGRYQVIDIGSADADAVKAHSLRDCGGCDAAIALKIGAEQSLVGVVRRISRTEYTIRFRIRDAQTSAIVSEGDSGLRMGANYSWSRGAVRLISDRLLESKAAR